MKKLFMTGPRTSEVKDVEELVPKRGEVLVKVKYTGVCTSEWHPWSEAKAGMTMGHEPMGIIVQVGEAVKNFKVGDRVSGLAKTSAFAEYCLIDELRTLKVPDNVDDEDALAEPLSCIVSVASKLRIEKAGDPVVMVGVGYMGLGVMSLLKLQGAGKIIAVDVREEALENAKRFGATECYTPENIPEQYLLREWNDDIWAQGLGVVSEFTGTEEGLRLAGDMTRPHGTLGVGAWHQGGDRTVDFRLWGWKAITVINTHERRDDFQFECCKNAFEMLSSGVWNYKGVSNHIYEMKDFDKANYDLENKPNNFIKALIKCSEF